MQQLWQVAFGVAGIGAVVAFVFWSLYRNWLKLAVFQRMTKRQQFIIFILFLCLTFVFAVSGLAAYVIVQVVNPAQRAAENSVGELSQLVRARRENILSIMDKQDKFFASERQKAVDEGKPTDGLDAKIKLLHSVKDQFERLSGEYAAALDDRQFVRSHELLHDIYVLLDQPETQALFPERVYYGDKPEPMYVPTRKVTRAFFQAIPKDLQGRVREAFPDPDPFGQDYSDNVDAVPRP